MISCKEATERATDYLEHGLSFWQAAAFRVHLIECRNCRRFLDQLRKTIAFLGRLPPDPVLRETRAELLRRFRAGGR
jgi:hypothetical protein